METRSFTLQDLPFGLSGNWYRGNLHTHSTRSDGRTSPAEVCAHYRAHGYDFISLTDHFRERYQFPITDTTPYRTDDFTTILGAELHAPATSLGDEWHILAVGLPPDFAPTGADETGPQLAERAVAAGAYVAAAHPAWYDLTDQDILSVPSAQAIEIFNTACTVGNGKGDSTGYIDRLLSQERYYQIIATDDAHFNSVRPDSCRNWVMVRSSTPEPADLLAALHAGHFYSSQGPEFLEVTSKPGSDMLAVRTSPVRDIYLTGRGAASSSIVQDADFTSAELDLKAIKGPYARLTAIDHQGRRAWTNPFRV
ncbi:MAG: phosphotransferase [Caldilineaceae bacterium SB0665_bin_21]|nr:phosphotransferase [Caldilineaceae bacterium SB0665_bin_21]MYA03828.1 phosphotransferase [Caldilineaceae bacterium SB0664_bin_22]MYC62531.1 phosphotransferase [Caldilineaceae bacterium SB0661_bin_34]